MKRREFLTRSGAAVAGGVALGTLGGITTACGTSEKAEKVIGRDVLVVGGGPAGVCAAIAAARNGASAMILEQGGCLGGMATRGLVAPFMTCYDTTGEVMVIRGLFSEIVDRMVALGGAIHPSEVIQTNTTYTSIPRSVLPLLSRRG